jgi:hypothetical protein
MILLGIFGVQINLFRQFDPRNHLPHHETITNACSRHSISNWNPAVLNCIRAKSV